MICRRRADARRASGQSAPRNRAPRRYRGELSFGGNRKKVDRNDLAEVIARFETVGVNESCGESATENPRDVRSDIAGDNMDDPPEAR